MACFAVFCGDHFDNKLEFIFRLFDTDGSNAIEKCELILTLQSAVRGLCKFANLPVPNIKDVEKIAENFFEVIDHDRSQKIEYDEFSAWIANNFEL